MYSPPINIRVKDNRAFGRKPLVGIHSVKALGPFKCKLPSPSQKTPDDETEVDGKLGTSFLSSYLQPTIKLLSSLLLVQLLLSLISFTFLNVSSCRSTCGFDRCPTPSEKDLAAARGRCRCPTTEECKRKGKGGERKAKETFGCKEQNSKRPRDNITRYTLQSTLSTMDRDGTKCKYPSCRGVRFIELSVKGKLTVYQDIN